MASEIVRAAARANGTEMQHSVPTCVPFPKARKRGRKVTRGPVADMIAFPRAQTKDESTGTRLSPRLLALLNQLEDRMAEKDRERDERDRARFLARHECNVTPDYYAEATLHASATPDKGRGPNPYAWGVEAAAAPLTWAHREEALQLAVEQLNVLAHLVRYGGLKPSNCEVLSGYDKEQCRDYEQNALTSLGEAMSRLRAFGAKL